MNTELNEETKIDKAISTSEKVLLAVGFLTILATMFGYKDVLSRSLNHLKFVPEFSVDFILFIMAAPLFCSIYFSSIANVIDRYSLKKSIFFYRSSHVSNVIADWSYILAIVLLPTALVVIIIISGMNYFFHLPTFHNYLSSSIIIGLITSIFSGIITTIIYKAFKKRHNNLAGAELKGANLIDAHLEKANLVFTYLEGANLNGAYLQGAYLKWTNLLKANFEGAHLHRDPFYTKDIRNLNVI